jgi:hypothetical protein
MLVYCGGIYLEMGGWLLKKKAPLRPMKGISKLQTKWGVGPVQFWLIISTFALGGSLSGRLCSKILNLVFLDKNWAFWLVYPLILTILWPFSVIFVTSFTGQF